MDDRTLTALLGSIAKWKAIVAGTGEDHGTDNCALCQEFFLDGCNGCPVFERTGVTSCGETPYDNFEYEWKTAETPERKAVAQAELDFLRSLLPAAAPK